MNLTDKICVTLMPEKTGQLKFLLSKTGKYRVKYVEVRWDIFNFKESKNFSEIAETLHDFGEETKFIFTVRRKEEGGYFRGQEKERLEIVRKVTELSPHFFDLEIETIKDNPSLLDLMDEKGVEVIASHHDFTGTPEEGSLNEKLKDAESKGDIAKIVTFAKETSDNLKILNLYKVKRKKLIAFCMGSLGLISRVLGVYLGAPFTYCSLPNEKAAPGQPSINELRGFLNVLASRTE